MINSTNILKILELFPDDNSCIKHLEDIKWKGVAYHPYCGLEHKSRKKQKYGRVVCSRYKNEFRITAGTIFHNTKVPLQKWFLSISLMLNANNKFNKIPFRMVCFTK